MNNLSTEESIIILSIITLLGIGFLIVCIDGFFSNKKVSETETDYLSKMKPIEKNYCIEYELDLGKDYITIKSPHLTSYEYCNQRLTMVYSGSFFMIESEDGIFYPNTKIKSARIIKIVEGGE